MIKQIDSILDNICGTEQGEIFEPDEEQIIHTQSPPTTLIKLAKHLHIPATSKTYAKTKFDFPLEVFGEEHANNMIDIAKIHGTPLNFIGTDCVFGIGSFAGNMYASRCSSTQLIYMMNIAETGTGKSPAFNFIIGNEVNKLDSIYEDKYYILLQKWEDDAAAAKLKNRPFTTKPPIRKERMIEGGTQEGIWVTMMDNPAGLSAYYDEGGEFFEGPNGYKKNTSSYNEQNRAWMAGKLTQVRADKSRKISIKKTAVSYLIGLHPDKLSEYFRKTVLDTGLQNRFLITGAESEYLEPEANQYSNDNKSADLNDNWKWRLKYWFNAGLEFTWTSKPYYIPLTEEGRLAAFKIMKRLREEVNETKKGLKHNPSKLKKALAQYDNKLWQNLNRLINIMAIYYNPVEPLITEHIVGCAEKLYIFYRHQAAVFYGRVLNSEEEEALAGNQLQLYKLLADEFTLEQAQSLCLRHGFGGPRYFGNLFNKKLKDIYVIKLENGTFKKIK